MAVSGADLLDTNGGDLRLSFFPGKTGTQVEALLDAYVADGLARSASLEADEDAQDRAVTAWGYVRAYRAILARMAAEDAASNTLNDQGSSTITESQFAAIQALLAEALKEFEELVPPTVQGDLTQRASRSITNVSTW